MFTTRFEVKGRVQGVFFRKYTQQKAVELGLRGFVMNTPQGTVVGEIQGPEVSFKKMKEWLSKTGSPKSRIDSVTWTEEKKLLDWTYRDFSIKK